MYIITNYINIDRVIAKKNIDRYFEKADTIEEVELDFNYLKTTGIDGSLEIKRLLNSKDEEIRKKANNFLYLQKNKVERISWQEFNINKVKLKQELTYIKYQINY